MSAIEECKNELAKLLTEAPEQGDWEWEDFFAGFIPIADEVLRLRRATEPDEAAVEHILAETLAYLESWRLSLVVARDEKWNNEVEASATRWAAGPKPEDVTSAEEIAAKLGVNVWNGERLVRGDKR